MKCKFKSRIISSEMPNYDTLSFVLGLIGKKISKKEFSKWSDRQKFFALEYATSQHLLASDNIIYKPPKEPSYVKNLKGVKI